MVLASPIDMDAPDVDTPFMAATETEDRARKLASAVLVGDLCGQLLSRITSALARSGVVPADASHEQAKAAIAQEPQTRLLMERRSARRTRSRCSSNATRAASRWPCTRRIRRRTTRR